MGIGETIGISILSAVVASFLTYYFGFRQYLKQRKREEIIDYYIKNGIDKTIESLDEASFSCRFNLGKAMRILEYMEKSLKIKGGIEKELVLKIFSEMQFTVTAPSDALYKIQLIIGEKNKQLFYWLAEALANYSMFDDYLRYELLLETRCYFDFPENLKGKEESFIKELERVINEINNKIISPHERLKSHLLNLRIRTDEISISTMKDFDKKLYKDKRIKEILQEIEKDYKEIKLQKVEIKS